MQDIGRLHVHLHELKDPLKERVGWGNISPVIRELVRGYVERNIMILDEKTLEVIDKGDFNKAVDLLLPGLQKLREERMQVGQKAKKTRTTSKETKKRKEAGIQTKQEQMAKTMVEKLMEGFK